MADDFVGIILAALEALDPYRDALRIETDDISTLMVGPPEKLFPAMRDLFVAASRSRKHCVLSACVSRGCPGEPDDPACAPSAVLDAVWPVAKRIEAARNAVAEAPVTGLQAAAQFSHYPLGVGQHMDEIYGCIEFLKTSGVFDRPKNFCTKLHGDAGPIFATLEQAFLHFGAPPEGHVTLDVTVSANSPTKG
jgi:uncharacterized protein YqgV (UPF0045/DUF77 family)